MTGPRAGEGGYDYMMQGLAGWQILTGEPDGPPTKSGLSLVDLSGGYASTIALLAGLWRARRDGVGCDCDVSLFETALHELMYVGTWAATQGYVPPRRPQLGASVDRARSRTSRPSDGWIVVAAAKQTFWERLCEVIGRARAGRRRALRDDGARATSNRDELAADPRASASSRAPCDEWLDDARGGRRAGGAGEHRARGARRPADARPRRRRRARAPDPRNGALDRDAASARRTASGSSAPGARPVPRRAHRAGARRALRLRAGARSRELAAAGVFGERRCARAARLRRLRRSSRPTRRWPNGARIALSFVLNYEEGGERHAARGRSRVGGVPARGRRRAADGRPAQPEHRVDVRVRQPRRLLARPPDLHRRTACR